MKRAAVLLYGIFCYLVFLVTFLYAVGFVGDLVVPKTIDSGTVGPLWPSLITDLGLLGLFGLQHSGMARPAFKRWWTKAVPRPIERSTYVLFASSALVLLYSMWQPLPRPVWSVDGELGRGVLWALFALGWGLVLISTFMISHAHLFGVSQVRDYFARREMSHPGFQTPGLYRHVRHPIMLGFFIAFWSTPDMSVGHLLFSVVTSLYILVALQLEERDLLEMFGAQYAAYRRRVPMLVPRPRVRRDDVGSRVAEQSAQRPTGS